MYVILGYGQQARAIIKYLLVHDKEPIITVDPIYNPHDHFPGLPEGRLTHHCALAHEVMWPDQSTVISCLPTHHNLEIAKECVERDCHYIDLGGDTTVTAQIEACCDGATTSFIPDCGIAPGLVSSIAAHGLELGYQGIDIYCGGLPLYPIPPVSYLESFSLEGLTKEYTGVCHVIEEGEHRFVPALSDREQIFVPGLGILEAEPTSGSISLAAQELPLHTLNYKTLRYPGHWDYMKNHVLNQPNPTEVLKRILPPVDSDDPDLLVLMVDLYSHIEGKEDKTYRWRWDYNHETNISAMAEITGYTVASVATICHREQLSGGFIPMHALPFAELKSRIVQMPGMFMEI